MVKLKDLLLEGFSSILYHVTSLSNGVNILNSDRFILTPVVGTDAESQKKFYYMSFARTMTSGYHQFQDPREGLIYFKINGTKLGQKYKGDPIDYWQYSKYGSTTTQMQQKMEAEDRLFSDKPFVPSATSYIDEIYVFIGSITYKKDYDISSPNFGEYTTTWNMPDDITPHNQSYIRKLIISSKRLNIPTYLYYTKTDLLTNNKKNAVKLNDIDLSASYTKDRYIERYPYRLPLLYKMVSSKDTDSLLKRLISREMEEFDNFKRAAYSSVYKSDYIVSLNGIFGNVRNSPDSLQRKFTDKIISFMGRNNIRDVKGLVEFLIDKYADNG